MRKKKSIFFIKVVLSYFALLFVVVSAFMIILYRTAVSENINSAIKSQQELTNKTAQQIDTYIYDIDELALQVTRTSNILNLFYKLQDEKNSGNYFEKNILNAIDITSALYSIKGSKNPIHRISIYNQYNDFVYTGEIISDLSKIPNKLKNIEVYNKMVTLGYSSEAIISQPQADYWNDNSSQICISIYRPLMNIYSHEPCGIVEVQKNISYLENLMRFDALDNIEVSIYDKNDNLIYPFDTKIASQELYETSAYSKNTDWKIILKQPKSQITGVNKRLIFLFIAIYTFLIFLVFALSYLIAQRITKPIKELRNSVNKFNVGNMKLKIDDNSKIDEIEELNNAFSDMLQRLTASIEHEKTAYSLAMQAQMNPHFLYNTLAAISAAGYESNNDRVVNMCVKLSDMLRYIASFEKSLVPLIDEINHTKNYLSLMKGRYEDYFSYSINVDETLYSMPIPKLIIQPLAENCFGHAFSNIEPPWNIDINIYKKNNLWYINVKDNGIGISEERIQEIKDTVNNYDKSFKYNNLKIGGLGLLGTIIRLRLIMGDNIQYNIENNNPHGTSVTISGEME